MDKIINGSSIYDVLSAIIPGYLVCLWVRIVFLPTNAYVLKDPSGTSSIIIIFTVSYLVGLFFKTISELLLNFIIRNKPCLLRISCRKAKIDKETKEYFLSEKDDWRLLRKYYIIYYIAVNNNANSSIGILEAQIAFIRSMILIILLYTFKLQKVMANLGLSDLYCSNLQWYARGFDIFLFSLIIYLQYRVHRLVWEDSFYALRAKKEEKP